MTVLVTLYLVIAELLVAQQPVALRGVTVLDGTGAAPLRNAVVIIQADRITAVGPVGQVPIPSGASVRDLPGKFLLPGFIDMHAHIAFGPVSQTGEGAQMQLRMDYDDAASVELSRRLLEYGITTIRNPAGPLPQAVLLRDRIARGEIPGPRTFTAGEVIDFATSPGLGVAARTDSAVRAIVRAQIAAGVDYVKLYAGLAPALVAAGIDEAHQHGKKAIAHTMLTSWTEAARAGIDGIVHIVPGNPRLLPPDRRAALLKSITGTQFMYTWFQFVDLASPEIDTMVAALTERRVVIDPTLVTFEAMFRGNDTAITRSPDLVTAPASLLRNWQSFQLSKGWSEADFAAALKVWPTVLAFTKLLHDRGVRLVVGTDTPNPWAAPGTSYHRELELLVQAGIPSADVLRMATERGAQALGISAEVGTIAPGKHADLVLLDADPLASIRNTRRIVWVMQRGKIVHQRRP
jgi:imidazolonepropionase-like amidohydrolase